MESTKCTRQLDTIAKYSAITTTSVMYGAVMAILARIAITRRIAVADGGYLGLYVLSGAASLVTLSSWHITRSLVKTQGDNKSSSSTQRFIQLLSAGVSALWMGGSAISLYQARKLDGLAQVLSAMASVLTVGIPVTSLSAWHAARR